VSSSERKAKTALGALVACAAAAAGFYAAAASWGGTVIVHSDYSGARRNPAAIRRVFDFSHLDGSALRLASQKRLVTDARIVPGQGEVGVELGHFVTKADDGSRLFACEYYDRLTLTFEAENVADSGEKATMQVEAPCRMSHDLNRIAPIWIPVGLIAAEKPIDSELSFPGSSETRFRFENIRGQWPRSWVMTSVTIFNGAESERELSISRSEMRELEETPIRVAW
jgi:hypothetical protein